jgi:DNA transformation protein and related proteins
MPISASFRSFVIDQLDGLGEVTSKAMFGGVGLYCGDLFFGLIARDALYLKVDDDNRPDYQRAGMKPFRPFADRPGTMGYYEVPTDILESASDLTEWARRSVRAAERSRTKGGHRTRRDRR